MGLALSSLELTAAVLLLAAAGLARAVRRHRWARWPLVTIALLPPLGLAALSVVGLTAQFGHFKHTLLLVGTVALLTGALLLAVFGLRRGRAADWSAGRLAIAAGVALALFVATLWSMVGGLQARVAALRAEAGTLALAAAPAPVANRDDAAPLYEAAYELMPDRRIDRMRDDWSDPRKPLNANDPALTGYLARHAGGLELLRQAVRRPSAHLGQAGPSGHLDVFQFNRLYFEAGVLGLAARVSARQGHAGPAIRDAAGIFIMARHGATAEVDLAPLAMASALELHGLAILDDVLTHVTPTRDELTPLRNLPPILFRYQLRRAFQVEQASAFAELAQLCEDRYGAAYGLILDEELTALRTMMQVVERELSKPYPDFLNDWPRLEEQLKGRGEAIISRPGGGPPLVLPPAPLARQSIRTMLLIPAWVARADATHRVMQLGVAVAEFRAAEGRYPKTADELVPKYLAQVPPDPFDGRPLRLKPTSAGVVVYSVGPDREDNGGEPLKSGQPTAKGDISLRIGVAKK